MYVKAGAYPGTSPGTPKAGVIYIGYTTTPGDIVSTNASTFTKSTNGNVTLSSAVMPTFTGPGLQVSQSIPFYLSQNNVHFENFQIQDYFYGNVVGGGNVRIKNVIVNNCRYGLRLTSSVGGIVENSFIVNPTGDGINIGGGDNWIVRNTTVRSDWVNPIDPTPLCGYYYTMGLGATGNIVENCTAYRIPETRVSNVDYHQGHGFMMKAGASGNVYRNCVAYNTGIELNMANVTGNTWDGIEIYGDILNYPGQFSTGIRITNGANNNTFKNIYMKDAAFMAQFYGIGDDYNGEFRDIENSGGYNNTFYNIVVDGVRNIIQTNAWWGDPRVPSGVLHAANPFVSWTDAATAQNNTGNKFYNITINKVYSTNNFSYTPFENNTFENVTISNAQSSTWWQVYTTYGNPTSPSWTSFDNNNFFNNAFSPQGTNAFTLNPTFTDAANGDYSLQSTSPLIDIGKTIAVANTDFLGNTRPATQYDIGAYEFTDGGGSGGPSDTTPPAVSSISVDNITDNSFRVDWTTNEASKGRIYLDTITGTVAGDYYLQTALESSFLTRHIQSPGPDNPQPLKSGTTYYWRIYTEDASGNTALSAEQTTTTSGEQTPTPPPAPNTTVRGTRFQYAKKKKN